MKKQMVAALFTAGIAMGASAASAVTVAPGSQVGIQLTGNYATTDGLAIGAGSVLEITNTVAGPFTFAPIVASIGTVGTVDLEGLANGDLTTGFVGDTITVDGTTAPSFDFVIDTVDADPSFVATTKEATFSTSIPAVFGDDVVLEGFGLLDGAAASWSFTIAGSNATGGFTLFVSVPPEIDVIPLPAGAPLLVGALGALAYVRRRKAA